METLRLSSAFAVGGFLAGAIEANILSRAHEIASSRELLALTILYAIVLAALSVPLPVALFFISDTRRRDRVRRKAILIFLILPSVMMIIRYANYFMPFSARHPVTILFTLITLLIAFATVRFVVLRVFSPFSSRQHEIRLRVALGISSILCLLLLAPLLSTSTSARKEFVPIRERAKSPNVLVVLVDTLRYPETEKGFKSLASQALAFERVYSTAPLTPSSVASLLTGYPPKVHRMDRFGSRLPASAGSYIPEMFHAAGYRTAFLSNNPFTSENLGYGRGVDYFVNPCDARRLLDSSSLHIALYSMTPLFLGQLRDVLIRISSRIFDLLSGADGGEFPHHNYERDALIIDKLGSWITSDRSRPFWAFVHLMSVHAPYGGPSTYEKGEDDRMRTPPGRISIWSPEIYPVRSSHPLPRPARENLAELYESSIRWTTTLVDRLLYSLQKMEILEQTVVVLTSDHGEEFFEHGGWQHGGTCFNEVMHVPFLLRLPASWMWPDTPSMQAVFSQPVLMHRLTDALLGTTSESSLSELEAHSAICERHYDESHWFQALVRGTSKLYRVRWGSQFFEYRYDLENDPGEVKPLIDRRFPELRNILDNYNERFALGHLESGPSLGVEGENLDALRSLGYID